MLPFSLSLLSYEGVSEDLFDVSTVYSYHKAQNNREKKKYSD
jgi:hypothetical protein